MCELRQESKEGQAQRAPRQFLKSPCYVLLVLRRLKMMRMKKSLLKSASSQAQTTFSTVKAYECPLCGARLCPVGAEVRLKERYPMRWCLIRALMRGYLQQQEWQI